MNGCNKKQLIVGPLPPPVGGVSSALQNLVKLFKNSDVNYTVFSTSSGSFREDLYARKNIGHYFRTLVFFFRFIKFLFGTTEVKICHLFVVSNSAFFRDFTLLIILKCFRKKVIVHLHSKTSGELFLSNKLITFFGKSLNLSDAVLVLSEEHKDFFSNYINKRKLRVLENFVFSDDFLLNGVKNKEWLYVGRLSKMKGFFDLLDAIDLCVNEYGCKNIIINCLGLADTDKNQDKIEQIIKSKGLTNNIKLHGMVIGQSKLEFFKHCKGLVFPSHFENSPVVLKEAICAEMPIISSDINANKNILNRVGNSIYFETKNHDELAKAFVKLELDYDQFLKLRHNAKLGLKHDSDYAQAVIKEVLNEL